MKIEDTNIKKFIAISDMISLCNMSCGFLSIISSINNNFELAALLMIFAIMFDSVDGWVARKTNRHDTLGFGKNIDSLSDAVSFGVAPAIFVYSTINTTSTIIQPVVIIVSLLIVICGILRLTRYNVIANQIKTKDFIGFPIPGIAFILATYYLSGLYNEYLAIILSIIISLIMISRIIYPKFDNMPILAISVILIILLILPFKIILFNINIPALLLLLFCLYYLLINLIKNFTMQTN
ncbi:MAG: CDP-diacylglycerol--serine O-phosphatidyltransferase [Methanobrevibacter sp.]|uniref:archaetidylserine synthase n=1 Tax=Methanobrevibacter sp. TaxID=66852 RepID=UPI001D4BDD19|nr:archaetidylserine synthase [Methanobrevibacter sp.]MBE6489514.1 CDP-diacylglycerol--serine O-phosphatidyltransferase [Methanobrevibacter sp.]MEE0935421.1 archaetidylserine synthase [Methanobrevibacter sp.]